MTYQQTVDYLFSRLPMFHREGKSAYKPGLDNMLVLSEALGNPHLAFKSIHVAGTNGKGSTSHMLAAVLQQAGYKTGLYTSPHLRDFRERMRVDGQQVSEAFVVEFVQQALPLIEQLNPSFFELTTLMAFSFFAVQQVDVAIVEVGLGGRLDATNIIKPQISVITGIGFDHTDLLGDTLGKIAFEKAGIIKHKVPVVVGEYQYETAPVFVMRAFEEQTDLYFADRLWTATEVQEQASALCARFSFLDRQLAICSDLTGWYQIKNIKTVLETLRQLGSTGWNIPDTAILSGLSRVKELTGLLGRWQLINDCPRVILDTGHNEQGIAQIAVQLKSLTYKKLRIVLGMMRDKSLTPVLNLLPRDAVYYFTQAATPRALAARELQENAAQHGLNGKAYDSVKMAYQAALEDADEADVIFVGGSNFVVGEVI